MDAVATEQADWQLADGELAEALLSCEETLRRDYARMLDLVAEADSRGLGTALGYRDLPTLLSETLRISPRQARSRAEHARATVPLRSLSGAEQPVSMPETGRALAAGEINAEHVGQLHKTLNRVSGYVDAEEHADAERNLVALARQATPAAVGKAGARLLAYLDQDGTRPEEDDVRQDFPRREFHRHYTRDGRLRFTGELDSESATVLDGLFGTLAKPHGADAAGQPDGRTRPEREGDAVAEIIDLAARADELPIQGGERAVVTVTVSLETLESRASSALLDLPGGIGAGALRRLCCDAKVIPAVLGGAGETLDLGRAARHASGAQRRALALRDRGCAYPGCDRAPKWCTPHHIEHWADGGPSALANMVLLCARHHRRIHHSGWHVRIRDGLPEFVPPAWLETERRPLRNTAHAAPLETRAA